VWGEGVRTGGIERRGAQDDVYIKEALGSFLYAEINLLTKV